MTPLIHWASKISSADGRHDMTEFHWFDATNVMADYFANPTEVDLNKVLAQPMPFEKTMICASVDNTKVIIRVEEKAEKDSLFCIVAGLGQDRNGMFKQFGIFGITKKDGFANFTNLHEELTSKKDIEHLSLVIAKLLDRLSKNTTQVYQPYVRNTFINQKRIKKGKPPSFEWRTVTIEPKVVVSMSHGGTHASPRLHDRRGHWRTMKKSGKRVWVRDCKVGDPSKGVVFHDYKFSRQSFKQGDSA
jgi:hypothetical protein